MDMLKTLLTVINEDIRHKYYARVCDLKRLYTALITGEDMEYLLRKFDRHESDEMFKQRRRITQHITSSVSRNLMKPLYKVPRSNSVNRVVAYKDDAVNQRSKELEDKLDVFWGDASFDNWFNQRWIDLNGSDPNSWCVFEWKDYDVTKERATPYPFEVSSEEAIHYSKDIKNDLQFLVTLHDVVDEFGGNSKQRYTIYGKEDTTVLTELKPDPTGNNPYNIPFADVDGETVVKTKKGYFTINTYTHSLGFVPAFMVGFNRDIYTEGKTMISVIDDAVPLLLKMVKANSEMDLTAALHVFPQKIQYANRCSHTGCNNGFMPDGNSCSKCHGTGYETHKTAQDIIYLRMPKDKDDFLNLDNIVKYVSPSVELVQWQDRYIQELTIRCKEALYNSELFSKKQVAETATGKNIDLQNVYDSLYNMATAYSRKWKFGVESIASITDMRKDLIAFYTFSKDFKMKSLSDLYADLETINNSDGDSFIKDGINNDIAGIIYSEDPIGKARYLTQKSFFPFNGKSEKEIMYAMTTNYTPDRIKVLYLNYSWIFDEIENEMSGGINFYELTREQQKVLIDKKVNKILKEQEAMELKDMDNADTDSDQGTGSRTGQGDRRNTGRTGRQANSVPEED